MGEAKKRRQLESQWLGELSNDEKTVVEIAKKLRPILPNGACYWASMFLKYHLELRYGIKGEFVVGYVNDGTDDLYCSHAWFEFNGKMTDLMISRPLHEGAQTPGPLIVHGFELRPGWTWSYSRVRPPQGDMEAQAMLADPNTAGIAAAKENEHAFMSGIAADNKSIRDFLDRAPQGLIYEEIVRRLG